jgi:hypothetical protein
MPLRVLITNAWLSTRSGSELYASDVAGALLSRGHKPIVYSPLLGPLAETVRARTIPVVDDLSAIGVPPDVIHGHHNRQTITALLHFPGVPAVRVCHGWRDERPHPFPRILRYLCVDDTVRDRVVSEWGMPEARVDLLFNFVDLSKFKPRGPLPPRPARAVVFSNGASAHLRTIRRACQPLGITVDAIGSTVGNVAQTPESLLGGYDVVFAKARCALEAMAVGNAVVLCDEAGMGPLVTPDNFEQLRPLNFGLRTLRDPVTDDRIARELANYDPVGAAAVCLAVRATAGLDGAIDALLQTYRDVIEEWRTSPGGTLEDELRAAAAYLRTLEGDQTLGAQTHGFLRALYWRAERVAALRPILPTRPFARRLGAGLRRQ